MFKLTSPFQPGGDQPQAIDELEKLIRANKHATTLLGVTGSGKTYTIANLIQRLQKPTLVISHNKVTDFIVFDEQVSFYRLTPYTYKAISYGVQIANSHFLLYHISFNCRRAHQYLYN